MKGTVTDMAKKRVVLAVTFAALSMLASCGENHAGTVEFIDSVSTTTGPTTTTEDTASPTTVEAGSGTTTSLSSTTTAPSPTPVGRTCREADELADIAPVGVVLQGPLPRPAAIPTELSGVATVEKYLTLSFDAEQDPASVPALLEVLASHGIRTNFFVLAPWAEANPDLVRAIAAAGHEVGNHSYAHERMGEWEAEAITADLERAETVLSGLLGTSTRPWMRPPFGNRTDASTATAYKLGWTTVRWSNGSDDLVEGTPKEIQDSICADLLAGAVPGAILISHTFNPQTPAAVDRFIREMHDQGYVFVPLSVLTARDPAEFVIPLD